MVTRRQNSIYQLSSSQSQNKFYESEEESKEEKKSGPKKRFGFKKFGRKILSNKTGKTLMTRSSSAIKLVGLKRSQPESIESVIEERPLRKSKRGRKPKNWNYELSREKFTSTIKPNQNTENQDVKQI